MCGINGFNFSDKTLLSRMNKAISHRGPDGTGTYVSKDLSMGHLRLKIIDLSTKANQPLYYSKQRGGCNDKHNSAHCRNSDYVLVFNGEIYNYKEIKEELIEKGYPFTTESDTEVVLAAYDCWGKKCVEHFNGMWSFALLDKKKNELFLCIDRLGQKPLYYYNKDGVFLFSSELKGILAHNKLKLNTHYNINTQAIELYFSLGHIPAPMTAFMGCKKLQAGHYITYSLDSKEVSKQHQYYDLPAMQPSRNVTKLIEEGREILQDAVSIRMRSDVPVGVFLSGGLDSSTIVSQMKEFTDLKKLHTFSMGFPGKYDETKYINIVKNAFKTKHHHSYFKEKDFKPLFEKFAETYDEPFWDYSSFPLYNLSKEARKKVVVVLSGDGGDEMFGGYTTHHLGYLMQLMRLVPRPIRWLISRIPSVKKYTGDKANLDMVTKGMELSLYPKSQFIAKILHKDIVKTRTLEEWSQEKLRIALKKGKNNMAEGLRIYDLLFNTLQNNFLVKGDRTTMQHALELRSPFLDYRFAEFAQRVPTNQKLGLFSRKKILKKIIKGIVPEEILVNRKQGFEPPFEEWLLANKTYTNQDVDTVLGPVSVELADQFKEKIIGKTGRLATRHFILLYLYELWYKKWIISK